MNSEFTQKLIALIKQYCDINDDSLLSPSEIIFALQYCEKIISHTNEIN